MLRRSGVQAQFWDTDPDSALGRVERGVARTPDVIADPASMGTP